MLGYNNSENLPISPMKKLKILSENQNIHNSKFELNGEYVTKYDVATNELKSKMNNLKSPQKQQKEIREEVEEDVGVEEPLLKESIGQYVIFPIKHDDMWHMYKVLVENFWSITENLDHIEEQLGLNANEIKFFKILCSFYAALDHGIVNENYSEEFSKIIQITEAKFYYGHQLFVQNIHFEMYNKLFETLVKNNEGERDLLFQEMDKKESVKNKHNWINQWANSDIKFQYKLIASACLHGTFFCTINLIQQWLKSRSNSTNTSYNHELIDIIDKMVIDQDSHRDFACLMISHLKNKPSREEAIKMLDEATRIEREFLFQALPFGLINITAKEVNNMLDRRSTLLKLKLLRAVDTTPILKAIASDRDLINHNNTNNSCNNNENSSTKDEKSEDIKKNIRFDEEF